MKNFFTNSIKFYLSESLKLSPKTQKSKKELKMIFRRTFLFFVMFFVIASTVYLPQSPISSVETVSANLAPAWQATSNIAASTGADVTVTLPAHATDDILLMVAVVRNVANTATVSGWTSLGTADRGTTARYYWFWKRATSGAETNPLFDKSGTTGDTYALVTTYRGAFATGDPWEVKGTAQTGTTDPGVLTGITTLSTNALVVAAMAGEDNNNASIITTGTDPAAYTEVYDESVTGADGVTTFSYANRATAGATGNVSVNWNTAVPVGWGGLLMALKGVAETTTLGDGYDAASTTNSIAPGAAAEEIDRFSLVSNATDTVTGMTVTLSGYAGSSSAYELISTVDVQTNNINALNVTGSASPFWTGISVNSTNGDVYVSRGNTGSDGDIYKQTAGSGAFNALNATGARQAWNDVSVNSSNGDVYAVVSGGDIYKQTAGSGAFNALNATGAVKDWTGVSVNSSNGDVYATVYSGDIYKQTAGSGAFNALNATGATKVWYGVSVNSTNGDVYAAVGGVSGGDIYKQTAGSGAFNALGGTTRQWYGIYVNPTNGDVYAVVSSDAIYKQTAGSGFFNAIGGETRGWNGVSANTTNGDVYASATDIYKIQTNGVSKCSLTPSSNTVLLTSCAIAVTTSLTEYVVKITPKTHVNMPAVPGYEPSINASVTSITATNSTSGTDSGIAVRVDNGSPAAVTSSTVSGEEAQNSMAWTNSINHDAEGEEGGGTVVVLRRAGSAITQVPAEGTTYTVGNVIGGVDTVACVVTGSPPAQTCADTGLTNGTAYHYKIFTQDSKGNYDAGTVPTGSPATPAVTTLTQAAYRVFDNTNTMSFGSAGSTSSVSTTYRNDVFMAKDSTYVYTVAGNSLPDWVIEKRLISSGALDTGFGTAGIVTSPSTSSEAFGIAIDSTYMYVVGYAGGVDWRIEKRLLSTGALCDGTGGICGGVTFGTAGVVNSDTTSYVATAIAIDATYMYVAGSDNNGKWRIEKRLLTTGAVDNGFGTAGVITGAVGYLGVYTVGAMEIDSTYMYVTGRNSSDNFNRIEKRLLTTGALCDGTGGICGGVTFGTAGVITGTTNVTDPSDIAIDSTYMYVAYYYFNNGTSGRIDKRLLTTGALCDGTGGICGGVTFGTAGIVTTAGHDPRAIAIDSTYMYVAGYGSSIWRTEKRLLTTGAVDSGFGTSGVVTSSPSTLLTSDITIDSTYMYVVGSMNNTGRTWRVEKRLLSTGAFAFVVPGSALAAQDTAFSLTSAGQIFRLRGLLTAGGSQFGVGTKNLKLQYAEKSGTCDTAFSGETYADITTSTPVSFYNNSNPPDGDYASLHTSDPTGGRTINPQTYEELNSFTNSVTAIPPGQDGLWDFSLYDNGAVAGTAYCIRAVRSDGGGTVDSNFGTSGVVTGAATNTVAQAIAIDSTYIYAFGYNFGPDFRIEKRLLTTGALCDGTGGICGGVTFGTDGIIDGDTASQHGYGIAIDSTHMYVVGYDSSFNWRIEKRLLSTGALDNGFGTSGVITGDAASYFAIAIAIDSTYMYVTGANDSNNWRIEKRLLSTGALCTAAACGTAFDTDGIVDGDAASANARAIAIDSTYMYVAGNDDSNNWRIEKRLLSTGALCTAAACGTAFDTDGIVDGAAASSWPRAIAIDATYMYVAGNDDSNNWRIEKRLLSTGALDNAFGTSGVVTGVAASNQAYAISIDSTYMYVAGDDSTFDWRIEKRLLSTGAVDSGFGTSGVVTGAAASSWPRAIAIDATYMYVVGDDGSNLRIEKRALSAGNLNTYTVIPEISIYTAFTPIAFRSASTVTNASSTTVVLTAPAGLVNNDVMVASIYSDTAGTIIVPPAGWTLVRSISNPPTGINSIYYKRASGESGSYTFTLSSAQRNNGVITAWSGVALSGNPIDVEGGSYGANTDGVTTSTATGITTTVANTMILYVANSDNATTGAWTPPSGMTEAADTAGTSPSTIAYVSQAGVGATGNKIGTRTGVTGFIEDSSFLIALKPTSNTVTVVQYAYRWRNDDANEASASFLVDQNTPLTSGVYVGDLRRLRLGISNTGASTATSRTFRLEYSSGACSAWSVVPAAGDESEPFVMASSSYVTNASATTDLAGLSNPSGATFVAGSAMTTGNQTAGLTLATTKFTELEYSIKPTSNVVTGTTYCFRLTHAGAATEFTYTERPEIKVIGIVFRSRGGGSAAEAASAPPDPQVGGGLGGGSGGSGGSTTAGGTAVLTNNSVSSVTITSGGSGYSSPPSVSFCGGAGSGATGTAVLTETAVSSVTINAGGTGYTSAPTVVFGGACGGSSGGDSGGDSGFLYKYNNLASVITSGISEINVWRILQNFWGILW